MKKYIFSDKMLPNQANHKKLHLYFFCHNRFLYQFFHFLNLYKISNLFLSLMIYAKPNKVLEICKQFHS